MNEHKKVEFIESYIRVGNDYQWNDNHGEIVRCKDCKYWDEEEYAKGNLHVCNCPDKDWATDDTRNHSFVTLYKPEDYCSYGERKEK